MKKVIIYTTYEGHSANQLFIGSDIDSIEEQEVELDKHYRLCYGIGGFRKKILLDETNQFLELWKDL